MVVFTGYFAQLKKYQSAGLIPISIARITPEWFKGQELKELAPSRDLLRRYKAGKLTEDSYKTEYFHQLDQVKWKKVLKDLEDNTILLCYEKTGTFCHRHLLAEYLKDAGYDIKEFTEV